MQARNELQDAEYKALYQIYRLLIEIRDTEKVYLASLEKMLENYEKNSDWKQVKYIHSQIRYFQKVSSRLIELMPDL